VIHRLKIIVPGKLYRGSAPSPKDVKWLKDKLGIKKIISLDHKTGKKIDRVTKLLGIKHIMIPIDGSRKSLLDFLSQDLKKLALDDGPTFVHCLHGKDRTGLFTALFKCKYMGMNPEDAIKEAKSLGFGIEVDPVILHLFEKLIRSCKPHKDKDVNEADIVSNERDYISDNRDSYLDEARQMSFAPYLSKMKQWPYDMIYNEINDQDMTRQNLNEERPTQDETNAVPQVGQYNNNAGNFGVGPVYPSGGFITD